MASTAHAGVLVDGVIGRLGVVLEGEGGRGEPTARPWGREVGRGEGSGGGDSRGGRGSSRRAVAPRVEREPDPNTGGRHPTDTPPLRARRLWYAPAARAMDDARAGPWPGAPVGGAASPVCPATPTGGIRSTVEAALDLHGDPHPPHSDAPLVPAPAEARATSPSAATSTEWEKAKAPRRHGPPACRGPPVASANGVSLAPWSPGREGDRRASCGTSWSPWIRPQAQPRTQAPILG